MTRRQRLHRAWPIHLQPAAGFGVMLIVIGFFVLRPVGSLCCGNLPRLPIVERAIDLEPAPVLAVRPGEVTLDGQWSEPLDELLRARRRIWPLLHEREPFPGRLVLSCDEETGVEWFVHALAVAERAGYTDLMMAVRRGRGWDWESEFGAVRVRLANGPGTLAAHDYATYGELVQAVSQAARAGRPTLDVRAHH